VGIPRALVLALLVVALLGLGAPARAQDVAIRAGHVVIGGATPPLEGAIVLVRGGKVAAVGHVVEVPAGVPLLERPGAWLVPGFVDPSTGLGLRFDRDEVAGALARDVTVEDAFDPDHRDFARARAAGVTTVAVVPGDADLFGGAGVVVKTTGERVGAAPVAKLALGRSVLRGDRAPTSQAGAVALLREAITTAHLTRDPADVDPADVLGAFARGEVVGLFTVATPGDLDQARGLTVPLGLRVVFRLDPGFDPAALDDAEVKDLLGDAPAIVGPFDLDTPARALRVPARLARGGARVLFTSQAPDLAPDALRLTAALAVREGLDPATALDALSLGAAEALGVADRVGTLDAGKDGDMVLLDGPPLDLSSRVLEVWVDGRRVVHAPAPGAGSDAGRGRP
jgi:hypothetical protein